VGKKDGEVWLGGFELPVENRVAGKLTAVTNDSAMPEKEEWEQEREGNTVNNNHDADIHYDKK
jgi:hypothetical protein